MAAARDHRELQLGAMAATRKRLRCSWGADEQEMLQLMLNGQGRRQVTTCKTTRSSAMAMAMNPGPNSCDSDLYHQYELPAVDCMVEVDSHSALPPGWKRCIDLKSGSMYLFNWSTGASVPCNIKNRDTITYNSPTDSSSSTSGQYNRRNCCSDHGLLSFSACQPASSSSKASDIVPASWSCPAVSKDVSTAPMDVDDCCLQLRLGSSPADASVNSSLTEGPSHVTHQHRHVAPLASDELSGRSLSGALSRDAPSNTSKSHHHLGVSREVPFIIDDEDDADHYRSDIDAHDLNANDSSRDGRYGPHTDGGNYGNGNTDHSISVDAKNDDGNENRCSDLNDPHIEKDNCGNGNDNDSRDKELSMIAQGCSKCLMLVMLSPVNPRCPNCGSSNPIDFLPSHNTWPSPKLDREKIFGFVIKNSPPFCLTTF